jgi:hypothetical protein
LSDYARSLDKHLSDCRGQSESFGHYRERTVSVGKVISTSAMLITSTSIIAGGLFFWVDKVNALELKQELQAQQIETYISEIQRLKEDQKELRTVVGDMSKKMTEIEVNGRSNGEKLDIILEAIQGMHRLD